MSRNDAGGSQICIDAPVESKGQFLRDVIAGLGSKQKRIPSKYFYDELGSRLFDQITELPEYYPTRTELGIMSENVAAMASHLGGKLVLVEYGSGSSTKTRLLLDQMDDGSAYVPIDISGDHLFRTASEIDRDYPGLAVLPVNADYSQPVDLPPIEGRRVVYYPGSTIGNFEPDDARNFLSRLRRIVGDDGGILIGIDLKKDVQVLQAAYNDPAGITAAFNLNILRRANRELGANFDLGAYRHRAVYDPVRGRVEMHLVSTTEQVVNVGGAAFEIVEGEYIHTENSYKYTVEDFSDLASAVGFDMSDFWLDANRWFCVAFLAANSI